MKSVTKLAVSGFIVVLLLCRVNSDDIVGDTKVTLSNDVEVEGQVVRVDVGGQKIKLNRFLGIKYAEQERFAKPKEYKPENNKIVAKTLPPTCWQSLPGPFEEANAGARMWYNNTRMDEDCLYLNVWAPVNPSKGEDKMPVMVWIYGGGFFSGSSTLEVYDGSILAASQKVIVVSMQYRVGAFGFLRIPGVTGHGDVALGNEGLWDQTMALKWVQEHIESFQGDKNSVTIFGESAGAASVSALWLSPQSRHLFKRAIMQSASIYARWAYSTEEDAERRSAKFIDACGCNSKQSREEILKCLREAKVQTLVDKLFDVSELIYKQRDEKLKKNLGDIYENFDKANTSAYLYFDAPLRPVIDGHFLPSEPHTMIEQRVSTDSPEILMGVNMNEGMYFVLYGYLFGDVHFLTNDGKVEIPSALVEHHRRGDLVWASIAKFIDQDWMTSLDLAKKPAEHYRLRSQDTDASNGEDLMKRMDELTGDLDFICPTLKFAKEVSKLPIAKVFVYQFQKRTENFTMPKWVGVMHGYEIEYVFGMPRSEKFQKDFYKFNNEEKAVSDKMMKMWANFARYGNPTPNPEAVEIEWRTYDASGGQQKYLLIDDHLRMLDDLKKTDCEFWWTKDTYT